MQHDNQEVTASLPGENLSLWQSLPRDQAFPSLIGTERFDVAVVGGGIIGLTAAYILQKRGLSVAVIEARTVGSGVTGQTTGKISLSHGLIYNKLIKRIGQEKSRLYVDANKAGLEFIADVIESEGIGCDFHRDFSCVYTDDENKIGRIEEEVEVGRKLGIDVEFSDSLNASFPLKAAVVYKDQAYFHSQKYINGLAKLFVRGGGKIFEDSRVEKVKSNRHSEVHTNSGKIEAEKILIATHFPISNKGLFFSKMSPFRSYLLAARLDNGLPDGMYINAERPVHTIRKHVTDSGECYLITGGQNHEVGHDSDTVWKYLQAEQFARDYFPVESIAYRWSTQDNHPIDDIPFVGYHSFASDSLFVATGMNGWGLTNGTAAGLILSDLITEQDNPWKKVFDSTRIKSVVSKKYFELNFHVMKNFTKDYTSKKRKRGIDELPKGQGDIVEKDGKDTAVYHDESGKKHCVSPVCTHLGCKINWNNAEKSWDCPCHGSRFDADGEILHSPATKGLKKRDDD